MLLNRENPNLCICLSDRPTEEIATTVFLFPSAPPHSQSVSLLEGKKADIALPGGTPPESYETSLAIWYHAVLPATRHK